jgi:hypothetical protein
METRRQPTHYTWSDEEERAVDTTSTMAGRLPTIDSFADGGLIANNTATASFEHAQQR